MTKNKGNSRLQPGYTPSESLAGKRSRKAKGIPSPSPPPPRQRLYDLKAAAGYLGRSVWGVRELVWSGQIPVVKSGRKLYLDICDMERWIERNKERWI